MKPEDRLQEALKQTRIVKEDADLTGIEIERLDSARGIIQALQDSLGGEE